MPALNGTGPAGLGPMTGRGMGKCAGYLLPEQTYYPPMIYGRGGGRGWRHRYYATGLPRWARYGAGNWFMPAYPPSYPLGLPKDEELDVLKSQARYFENALNEINERLKKLEQE